MRKYLRRGDTGGRQRKYVTRRAKAARLHTLTEVTLS
jgi:hypothetical protein